MRIPSAATILSSSSLSMRTSNRIPAILALTLALALPTLAQSAQTPHAAQPEAAKTDTQKPTPPVDPNKTYLLHADKPAAAIVTAVLGELQAFLGPDQPDDDVTLVAIKVLGDGPA